MALASATVNHPPLRGVAWRQRQIHSQALEDGAAASPDAMSGSARGTALHQFHLARRRVSCRLPRGRGTPIKSASLNFTPGRSSRSSSRVSMTQPEASCVDAPCAVPFAPRRRCWRASLHISSKRRNRDAATSCHPYRGSNSITPLRMRPTPMRMVADDGDFLAVGVEHVETHRLGNTVASLKMCAISTHLITSSVPPQRVQASPATTWRRSWNSAWKSSPSVPGAGGESFLLAPAISCCGALRAPGRRRWHVPHAHRPERSGIRAEPLADFLGMRRAELGIVHDGAGLGSSLKWPIAAQQSSAAACARPPPGFSFASSRAARSPATWSCGRVCGTPRGSGRRRDRGRPERREPKPLFPGWRNSRSSAAGYEVLTGVR